MIESVSLALDPGMSTFAHQLWAPCPPGWSRADGLFGEHEHCAVPILLRDVANVWACVAGSTALCCIAYQLWRAAAKGATRSTMFRAATSGFAAVLISVTRAMLNLLVTFDVVLHMAMTVGLGLVAMVYAESVSTALLNSAVDAIYALRPAQASVWHGRVALIWLIAKPVCVIGSCCGGAMSAGGSIHDEERSHRGAIIYHLACLVGVICFVMLAVAARVTARAARALGKSIETEPLRKRLQRQSKASAAFGAVFGVAALFNIVCIVFPAARRVSDTVLTMQYALAMTLMSWNLVPAVLRSIRRRRNKRRERGTVTQVLPQRRVSVIETTPRTPKRTPRTLYTPPHAEQQHGAEKDDSRTPRSPRAVPLVQRGVSLAFLRAFVQQKNIGTRTTTGEVCEMLIKPATRDGACAYYDLLQLADAHQEDGQQWAGASHYFLSHSWSYRFRDLLGILEAFEEQTKPGSTRYYWLDIFVMNQHSASELGNLIDNLQAAVRSPGRLLLAVDSWRDPTPLTRVWCLLEVFTAIQQRAEVILCFSAAEETSFAQTLVQNQAEVQRTLDTVDAERAEATVAADRELIFGMIRRGTGFARFNDTIRDALRNSFERVVIAQRT